MILLLFALFLASYTEGVSICPSRELSATEGEVTSPNYPSEYSVNANCTLAIDGGNNVKLKIKFVSFEVEEDEDDPNVCKFDSLTIIDGPRSLKYCGRAPPPEYTSSGNKISIRFLSDASFQMSGFKISFSTIRVEIPDPPPGSSICPTRNLEVNPGSSVNVTGALHSPNSPNFYPDNQNCTVTLDVPDNYKTVVWLEKFSLQYSPSCDYDSLVLSDELDRTAQCGGGDGQIPPRVELKGKKVKFSFKSDDSISAAGFHMMYNITRLQQGRCACTEGLSYITINNYKSRNNRKQDDIRFEFKSSQSSGMIMYAKGRHRDYIYVAYKDSRVFMFHIDLGTGEAKLETTNVTLNDNRWHKVHLTRVDRTVIVTIDDGAASLTGRTPGGFNRLDIPSSRAYFLGTPTNQNLLPNFIGCIRDFTVDGYEPITNAWARKPDYNIVRRGSMRLCSSSDETR